MKSMIRSAAVSGLAMLLAGCSASYNVTKQTDTPTPILSQKGIYYMLPKTEVVVGVDGTLKTVKIGPWREKFKEKLEACQSDPSEDVGITLDDEPVVKMSFVDTTPFILTRNVPDSSHRYLLEVDFDSFSSFSHTIELTDAGVLTTADTTVTNVGVEVAKSTVTTIKDIALAVVGAGPKAPAHMMALKPEVPQIEGKAISDSCSLVLVTGELVGKFRQVEQRRAAFVRGPGVRATPESLARAMATFDAEALEVASESIQRQSDGKRIKYLDMIGRSVEKETLRYAGIAMPEEFQALLEQPMKGELLKIADGTPAGMPVVKVHASTDLGGFVGDALDLSIAVKPAAPFDFSSDCQAHPAKCKDDSLRGYRYRIPVAATVTLKSNGKKIAAGDFTIAQYGPIAALPTEIDGLKGSINLAVYGDSGALKKITVGAEPLPSSTISDFVGIGTDFVAEKRKAREAAKKAAEDQELNTLLKENAVLEAKKKNKELKDSLGIEE